MKTLKDAKRLEKTMSDLTCDLKEHKHHASHLCNEMLNTVTRLTPAVELDYEIKYNRERELLRYSIMGGVQQSVYKKLIKRKQRAGQKELDDLSEEEEEKSEGEDPIPEVDELRSSQKESMMTSSKNSDTSEEKEDSFIEKEVPE